MNKDAISMKCDWCAGDPLMEKYHDEEWGTPMHHDQLLFEHLSLDGFQAGLSWKTILHKRENFRKAFDNFNIEKVASYDQKKVDALLQDKGIVRNRLKIAATINNAQKVLEIQKEFGSFDAYFWSFTEGKTVHNHFEMMEEIPATSALSDKMSADLRRRGFKFVGSTIVYAILQAVGVVNDHLISCPRYEKLI